MVDKKIIDDVLNIFQKSLIEQRKREYQNPTNYQIFAVFSDEGFLGFKADSFWSLSQKYFKIHSKGDSERLLNSFLYFLNKEKKDLSEDSFEGFFQSLNTHLGNKKIGYLILVLELGSFNPIEYYQILLNLDNFKYELHKKNNSDINLENLFLGEDD